MLYRGVNKIQDEQNGGKIIGRGGVVEVVVRADGQCTANGDFFAGPSMINTARAHQISSGLYDGCGVSTSRSERVAIKFATSDFIEPGYVYVIDDSLLNNFEVLAFEFSDSHVPKELEVTLIAKNGGEIPIDVVIKKYEVDSSGVEVSVF